MNNTKSFEDKVDGVRQHTAESLEDAADSVRAAGSESADAISDLANGAGQRLDSTATYVRTFANGELFRGFRHTVRRNPVGSVALATAAGLVAGLAWRAACRPSHDRA
jgi:ElaB/YqjD/DUF883 family membrane-anchored ribosome-binding protein